MNRFIMLLIYSHLYVVICNAQYLRRESIFYPCLDIIVGYYYSNYFEFPKNTTDLVSFTEYYFKTYPDADSGCRDNILVEILPFLKENTEHITMEDDGYVYTIEMGNDTLLYVPTSFRPFSPCDDSLFIGGDPKDYYHFYDHLRTPRFFSSHNKAILLPDTVYYDFKNEVLNIQQKYIFQSDNSLPFKYYIYENDTIPILSMLEYNVNKPLHYYCNGELVNSKLLFYEKLESLLKYFCELYKCNRILFMLPDYNLPCSNHGNFHQLAPLFSKDKLGRSTKIREDDPISYNVCDIKYAN